MAYIPAGVKYRNQLELPFPIEIPGPLPTAKELREAFLRARQPKRFPPGWWRLSDDPDWRTKHYDRWSERRKAMGLPSIVHDRERVA